MSDKAKNTFNHTPFGGAYQGARTLTDPTATGAQRFGGALKIGGGVLAGTPLGMGMWGLGSWLGRKPNVPTIGSGGFNLPMSMPSNINPFAGVNMFPNTNVGFAGNTPQGGSPNAPFISSGNAPNMPLALPGVQGTNPFAGVNLAGNTNVRLGGTQPIYNSGSGPFEMINSTSTNGFQLATTHSGSADENKQFGYWGAGAYNGSPNLSGFGYGEGSGWTGGGSGDNSSGAFSGRGPWNFNGLTLKDYAAPGGMSRL